MRLMIHAGIFQNVPTPSPIHISFTEDPDAREEILILKQEFFFCFKRELSLEKGIQIKDGGESRKKRSLCSFPPTDCQESGEINKSQVRLLTQSSCVKLAKRPEETGERALCLFPLAG